MDPPERIVMRRKKMMLSNNFVLSDEQLARIWAEKLLKKPDHETIKADTTNAGRVGRLLDVLPVEGFEFLCDLLHEQNEWLSDELKTELRSELGHIEVEEYVNKESAVLVHREFGASKRLAQAEKLKLINLVASRTQYAKEVWRQQLERAVVALKEIKQVNAEKDAQAMYLCGRVNTFLTENRQRLRRSEPKPSKPRDPAKMTLRLEPGKLVAQQERRSPSSTPRGRTDSGKGTIRAPSVVEGAIVGDESGSRAQCDGDDEEESKEAVEKSDPALVALMQLAQMIDELVTFTEECAADREGLRVERARLLGTVKLEADDELTPVDARLKDLLATAAFELEAEREKVRSKEARTKELEHRLHEYWLDSEKTIEIKDETINDNVEHLKELHENARDLQLSIKKLEAELKSMSNELKQYKEKSARLEKNRRLGYKSDVKASAAVRLPAIKDGDHVRSLSGKKHNNNQATPWQVIEN